MNEMNLADVLETYALAAPQANNLQTLRGLMDKYPQFASELMDFAAARAVVSFSPELKLNIAEETKYREVGLKNLRAVLSGEQSPVLQSLTDAAQAKGMNRKRFAAALGLSVSLLQYLEKRRLRFATIPQTLIRKIAEILETGEETISVFLQQQPVYAAQTSFKTATRAEETPPKDFAEAVREDQTLSAEEKRELLQM